MQTQITARHFTASPALRQYASERLSRLNRYYDGITDAHIILEKTSSQKTAEITVNVYRQRLAAQDAGITHEDAIDGCVEHLRRQIKKYKARLRSTSRNAHH